MVFSSHALNPGALAYLLSSSFKQGLKTVECHGTYSRGRLEGTIIVQS